MSGANSKRTTENVGDGTKRKSANADAVEDSEPSSSKKQVTEEKAPPILNLPEEVLAKIIELVPVCQWPSLEKVSRQFRGATDEAWRQLRHLRLEDFLFKEKFVNQNRSIFLTEVLDQLARRTPNIRSISGFSAILPASLANDFPRNAIVKLAAFEHLETVNFAKSPVSMNNLIHFLTSSNSRASLKRLVTSYSRNGDRPRTEQLAMAFNQGREQLMLESLEIKGFQQSSQFLRDTSLPWLTTFKAMDASVSTADLIAFISQCPQLQHLELLVENWNPGSSSPPYQVLFNAVAALGNLSVLKLKVANHQNGSSVLQGAIIDLIQSLGRRGKMIEFGLTNWDNVNEEIVEAIANYLIGLVALELSIGGCSVPSIEYMGLNLKHLRRVCFTWPPGKTITTDIVSALATNFKSLECLRLENYTRTTSSCKFDRLAELRNLKELRLRDIRVTDSDLQALAATFGPQLEILELMECEAVTGFGLNSLIKNSPNLRRLVVMNAWLFDSALEVPSVGSVGTVVADAALRGGQYSSSYRWMPAIERIENHQHELD